EDRRRAGARLFYDGGDGQGFRLSRQGNRSAAGDATACGRVMNGHASMVVPTKTKSMPVPLWRVSPSIRADEFSVSAVAISHAPILLLPKGRDRLVPTRWPSMALLRGTGAR